MGRQKLKTPNLGNLLVILGIGTLVVGFWMPYGTAERVHRIESRAEKFAGCILEVVGERTELPWQDVLAEASFVEKVNEALGLTDPAGSIFLESHKVPDQLKGAAWWLEGKHYFYMITATPLLYLDREDQQIDRPGPKDKKPAADNQPGKDEPAPAAVPPARRPGTAAPRPIEVYAWPKDSPHGAESVFFFCSTTGGAFHRNLSKRYSGTAASPKAGDGFFHHATSDPDIYYGWDDARWQRIDQN